MLIFSVLKIVDKWGFPQPRAGIEHCPYLLSSYLISKSHHQVSSEARILKKVVSD